MDKVTVKTKATHFGKGILRKVDDEYETDQKSAEYLKGKGVIDYDGPAAEKVEGQKINIRDKSDSGKTSTAIIEQDEENQGKLIMVDKEKVEKKSATEKKEIKKPSTKK